MAPEPVDGSRPAAGSHPVEDGGPLVDDPAVPVVGDPAGAGPVVATGDEVPVTLGPVDPPLGGGAPAGLGS